MQVGHRYKVNKYKTVASLLKPGGRGGGVNYSIRQPPSCILFTPPTLMYVITNRVCVEKKKNERYFEREKKLRNMAATGFLSFYFSLLCFLFLTFLLFLYCISIHYFYCFAFFFKNLSNCFFPNLPSLLVLWFTLYFYLIKLIDFFTCIITNACFKYFDTVIIYFFSICIEIRGKTFYQMLPLNSLRNIHEGFISVYFLLAYGKTTVNRRNNLD